MNILIISSDQDPSTTCKESIYENESVRKQISKKLEEDEEDVKEESKDTFDDKITPIRRKNNRTIIFKSSSAEKKIKSRSSSVIESNSFNSKELSNLNKASLLINRNSIACRSTFGIQKSYKSKLYNSGNDVLNFHNKDYYYTKKSKTGLEYTYREDPNFKYKDSMEDCHSIVDSFHKNDNLILFSLFDGHGGMDVASYVRDSFPSILALQLQANFAKTSEAFSSAYSDMDMKLSHFDSDYQGSTACTVLIAKGVSNKSKEEKLFAYCANVGDTRCIVVSVYGHIRLSRDHNCWDKDESERIINEGGIIRNDRVNGQLMLTRAFGDHALRKAGVICKPNVSKYKFTPQDRYMIIATDGVWDVIKEEELEDICLKVENSKELTNYIINLALERESVDNISCISIKVN